ncbi:hypothetical protein Poli38472_013665 [Pythium oligandrum]|uniref:Uncharacterized protein n=1 Tax=Pythium oligandrum TaxID=41045 RepID=A0A8K1FIX4_PYTOL|nr:hypothetical protein Poli38472_013665 [Pythium oligandrum]|eukprot:TMW61202.1 hypothetical protein Poli38472_013665 [Pythium oligandrum]
MTTKPSAPSSAPSAGPPDTASKPTPPPQIDAGNDGDKASTTATKPETTAAQPKASASTQLSGMGFANYQFHGFKTAPYAPMPPATDKMPPPPPVGGKKPETKAATATAAAKTETATGSGFGVSFAKAAASGTESKPAKSGFSFGLPLTTNVVAPETNSSSSFSFGAQPAKTTTTEAAKGFSFGTQAPTLCQLESAALKAFPPGTEIPKGFSFSPPEPPKPTQSGVFGTSNPPGATSGYRFGCFPTPPAAPAPTFGGDRGAGFPQDAPRPSLFGRAYFAPTSAAPAAVPVSSLFGGATSGTPAPSLFAQPVTQSGASGFVFPTQPVSAATPTATPVTAGSPDSTLYMMCYREPNVVFFPSRKNAQYRYELTVEDGKTVQFWLEDRETKHQWESDKLKLKDFVNEKNTIPQASIEDYASCFETCLNSVIVAPVDPIRDLLPHDTDDWELQLCVVNQVFRTTWTLQYSFILKKVDLDPMTLLQSRLRDQEAKIQALESKLQSLSTSNTSSQGFGFRSISTQPIVPKLTFVRALTRHHTVTGRALVWERDSMTTWGSFLSEPEHIQFLSNGNIRILQSGVYVINLVVQNQNSNNGLAFELQQNQRVVASCTDSNPSGHRNASPLNHVLHLVMGDELLVIYKGTNIAESGSSLVMHQIR